MSVGEHSYFTSRRNFFETNNFDEMAVEQNVDGGFKVFIGGLSHVTTNSSLKTYFKAFGKISNAEVLRDRNTLSSRGFGFVTFTNKEVAINVIGVGLRYPHIIDGKAVDVKRAISKEESRQKQTKKNQKCRCYSQQCRSYSVPVMNVKATTPQEELVRSKSLAFLNMDDDLEASCLQTLNTLGKRNSISSASRWSSVSTQSFRSDIFRTKDPMFQDEQELKSKIFVGGLLYSTGHEILKKYFEQFGEIHSAEVIYNRETKRSRGFGFVIFKDPNTVKLVLRRQTQMKFFIDGKEIEVKTCKAKVQCVADQLIQNSLLNSLRKGERSVVGLSKYQSHSTEENVCWPSYEKLDTDDFLSDLTLLKFSQKYSSDRLTSFEEKEDFPHVNTNDYFMLPKALA